MLSLEQRILRGILPDLRGKKLVDVGCGTGRWLRELASRASSATGVDASPEMLRMAERNIGSSCTLIQASCPPIPLPTSSADVVICSFLSSYMADVYALAEELRRISRPGAEIFVSDLHPDTVAAKGWRREFRVDNGRIEIATKNWSLDLLLDAFSRAGFAVKAVVEPRFGDAEREVFRRSDREAAFEAAIDAPAIFVLHLVNEAKAIHLDEPLMIQRALGARIALGPRDSITADLEVDNGRIEFIGSERWRGGSELRRSSATLNLDGFMIMPGLVNAHDHLEFALFPRLGHGDYANYLQWAEDIYQPDSSPVKEHRLVPKDVRLWWGGLRNLLAGVTSVCHHNPYVPEVFDEGFPVRVLRDFRWTHSLGFSEGEVSVEAGDTPFILHLGEGVDETSACEFTALAKSGALRDNVVIVHGLSLDESARTLLNKSGASLVWCPTSNNFLFSKTHRDSDIAELERVAIGSDSSLTANGDLLDEIRFAHSEIGVPADALYAQATTSPGSILRMHQGEGTLRPLAVADFIAVQDSGAEPADMLVNLTYREIELVVVGGIVQLASSAILNRLPESLAAGLAPFEVAGLIRWVRAPLGSMFRGAERSLGCPLTMNGRSLRHVASGWL
jgi:cytosine/adenosine deaminase-related metal-dependent hydrolase/ubiquinone/menaquinone biosynthesis C-methylase UbiE